MGALANHSFRSILSAVAASVLTATLLGFTTLSAQTNAQSQAPGTAPQVQEVLPSYEGQHVVSVEIAGRPDVNEQQILPLLAQRPGEPFAEAKVDESIAALKKSGQAKEVQLEVRPQADGVRVLLVLQPAMYFGIYKFPGAERFAYSRLLQVTDYPPRGAFSAVDVKDAQQSATKFFEQNGYFQAQVVPKLEIDNSHGLVNVIYQVQLNRHAKFGSVILKGVASSQEQLLQQTLKSKMARLRGAAIRPGKSYSLHTLQKARQYLESVLIQHDYLGSRVQLAGAEYDPATGRADVHFDVTLGPPVAVKIEGAHLWGRTRRKLLPIYQEAGLDPELIQEGRQNLISYFQSKGYFDVSVRSEITPVPNEKQVVYLIVKGARHKVSEVAIAGNQTISKKTLMGHVKVKKARIPYFSHGTFSEHLLRESAENLKRVYQSEGFSTAEVKPEATQTKGNLIVRFRVIEGPRDMVSDLLFEGNKTVPEFVLAPKGLKIAAGQPYSAKHVDEDRNQIVAQYLRMGYLNASFQASARPIGKNPHRLDVTYKIIEGPKVTTGSIVTLGQSVTRQWLIDRAVRLRSETALREDNLFSAENRLYDLGIFDWAEIDPRRSITTQTEEDVLVKLHESRRNEIKYGVGFEVINRGGEVPGGTVAVPGLPPVGLPSTFTTSQKTFWGPRGTIQYTRRNLRGLGESITLSALGARLVQRGSASFGDPHFVGTNWNSTFTISGEHNSENPIFTSRLGDFDFQLQRPLNPDNTQQLTLDYSLRQTRLSNLLIPDLVPPQDRNVRLSTVSPSYVRDTRDSPLDAKKGIYETAEIDFNSIALGSSVNFARLRAQAAYYKDIGAGIIWANSVRIGAEKSFAGSRIPLSELFFSGGGSTLRGFPLNGAGPQRVVPVCSDPSNPATCSLIRVPVGGRELFILNSEFRIPVPVKKGLGLAAFYDGGNVFEHVGFHDFAGNYTNTLGIGLRYATPVGPVRIDIGHNFNALPGIKATQIFITLGQAF